MFFLRLATQVQARTQQPTAMGGQSRHLLVRTHVHESSREAPRNARSSCGNPLSRSQRVGELPPAALGWLDMVQRSYPMFNRCRGGLMALLLAAASGLCPAVAQQGPFQIVWVVIGEASSVSDKAPAHAGRQLFMASDLVSKSLANVRVERVEVAPVVNELAMGQRLCLTNMSIRALGPGKQMVGGAPLSISVRQDQKPRLGLSRSKRDICLQPSAPGEYPVRLTSMLPATDGTTRGAQVYLRVSDPDKTAGPSAPDIP